MTGTLRRGFAMMDVLVAMAILGLLLAIAGPSMLSYLKRGNKLKTEQHLNLLKQSINQYYADTSSFPHSLDDLVDKPDADSPLARRWQGPYVEAKGGGVPEDGWGHDFVYERTPGAVHPYELYSYGSEGEDGPEEDRISAW